MLAAVAAGCAYLGINVIVEYFCCLQVIEELATFRQRDGQVAPAQLMKYAPTSVVSAIVQHTNLCVHEVRLLQHYLAVPYGDTPPQYGDGLPFFAPESADKQTAFATRITLLP